MKGLLLLLDVVMIIVAVQLTSTAWDQLSAAPVSQQPVADAALTTPAAPTRETMQQIAMVDVDQVEVIWERNLFHPDRAFETLAPKTPTKTPDDPGKIQETYELVGVAQVRDIACASIIVHQTEPKRTARARKTKRTAAKRNSRAEREAKKRIKAKKKNRKLYKLTADVGDTGYILAEIHIKSVVLRKEGAEDITLTMDKGDERSIARNEESRKTIEAEKNRKIKQDAKADRTTKARKRAAAKVNKTPPAPPPPPPTSTMPTPPRDDATPIQHSRRATAHPLSRAGLRSNRPSANGAVGPSNKDGSNR